VNLVVTSPPYALHFQKEYGNVEKRAYIDWFLGFASEIKRVLAVDGSFVLNIGGSYNEGQPTRSLYHFKLLIALCDELGFHLAQECFWFNPAKLPAPAEWVNVRRIRIKDSVEYVWWLAPSPTPYADNREVLAPYSADMKRLLKRGYKAKERPSGHNITAKFKRDHGGSIPANVVRGAVPVLPEEVPVSPEDDPRPSNFLERGNNESNSEYIRESEAERVKVHPARFPAALPEFFIKFLTREGDLVLDPFAGSNTSGRVAENLERRWIGMEIDEEYARNSALRFGIRPNRVRT
jgi:site-specific DNA-methyltransferase (cytosine-N4-specific)